MWDSVMRRRNERGREMRGAGEMRGEGGGGGRGKREGGREKLHG